MSNAKRHRQLQLEIAQRLLPSGCLRGVAGGMFMREGRGVRVDDCPSARLLIHYSKRVGAENLFVCLPDIRSEQ